MSLQELLRLITVTLYVMPAVESRQVNFLLFAHRVREVGVDGWALRLFDEIHRAPQALADILLHADRDVRPVIAGRLFSSVIGLPSA
jgi:hypothetical protein